VFFQGSITFFIFDGITFTEAPPTQSSPNLQSWQTRTLLLPTGQVLYMVADGRTKDVEVFTTAGSVNNAWRPKINRVSAPLNRGSTSRISGTQFNGLYRWLRYGDDALSATNYPLVRITNNATGMSSMPARTTTARWGSRPVRPSYHHVDVPATAETGASTIEVVANGIASRPVAVTIQ
jgi:hypothetical protein